VLVGHLVNTDLSNTLSRIQEATGTSVRDLSLSAPQGQEGESSARLRLATETGQTDAALSAIRDIADEKGLRVVEPLTAGGER
jgi:ACT domain-containing protein